MVFVKGGDYIVFVLRSLPSYLR